MTSINTQEYLHMKKLLKQMNESVVVCIVTYKRALKYVKQYEKMTLTGITS